MNLEHVRTVCARMPKLSAIEIPYIANFSLLKYFVSCVKVRRGTVSLLRPNSILYSIMLKNIFNEDKKSGCLYN